MNNYEREMLDLLKRGKQEYGYTGVKAEFESEGTRTDELLRLLEIARRADLNVGLKIGGCEAIRDMIEAKQYGVDYIIAPMVETPYALSKYIDAIHKVYNEDEAQDTQFLFNLETITGYSHLDEIVTMASQSTPKVGIVFGRVDFTGSNNMTRQDINTPQVQQYSLKIAKTCRDHDLPLVVGGGVAIDALDTLREIHDVHLDRFETRKVIWSGDALNQKDVVRGLENAVNFELLWLKNKQSYYQRMATEDETRIEMLQSRWDQLKAGRT